MAFSPVSPDHADAGAPSAGAPGVSVCAGQNADRAASCIILCTHSLYTQYPSCLICWQKLHYTTAGPGKPRPCLSFHLRSIMAHIVRTNMQGQAVASTTRRNAPAVFSRYLRLRSAACNALRPPGVLLGAATFVISQSDPVL
jgi:hypothetical protein